MYKMINICNNRLVYYIVLILFISSCSSEQNVNNYKAPTPNDIKYKVVKVNNSDNALPKNHLIYNISDVFKQPLTNDTYISSIKPLEWEFVLPKKEFNHAEIIEGEMVVTNPNKDKYSFKFSPPYKGNNVCTIGVWCSQWDDKKNKWSDVKQIQRVTPFYQANGSKQFQGVPKVLKPQESFRCKIPINTIELTEDNVYQKGRFPLWWFSGIGLNQPGKYKFYLRYINLEKILSFEDQGKSMVTAEIKNNAPIIPSAKPIILGPAEIIIHPLKNEKLTNNLIALFKNWQDTYKNNSEDHVSKKSYDVQSLQPLLSGLNSKNNIELIASLKLTLLRNKLRNLQIEDIGEKKNNLEVLQKILLESKQIHKKLNKEVLKNAYLLTDCYILKALGKYDEALTLAEEINNPDSEVFIYDLKEELKKQKVAEENKHN